MKLPRPLPPAVRARWEALDPWLRAQAQHHLVYRDALRAHVVDGAPLEAVLEQLRAWVGGAAAPWPDGAAEQVAALRAAALAARKPMATGGSQWG